MFELNSTISKSSRVDEDDVKNTKSILRDFGLYPNDKPIEGFTDNELFDGIKDFQKIVGVKVDGVMRPKGETEKKIQQVKKKGAIEIYKNNRDNMVKANTIGADKYFHCKANYDAIKNGHETKSHILNSAREIYGHFKGDGLQDMLEDSMANMYGQVSAKKGHFKNSKDACKPYRPKGLNEKY